MLTPRLRFPIAILLVLAGCRDAAAPLGERNAAGPRFSTTSSTAPYIIQQSPTAPLLQTYQLSFWVRHDRESTVEVDYQPAAGQSVGQPFLRFHIPKFGMMYAPDGTRLLGSDSLLITLTIDTLNFLVDFEPSGVKFSTVLTPQLVMWYANANPDLNGDGVVDATDAALEQQLAIWGQTTRTQGWFKTTSNNDTTQQYVVSNVYHFSNYAVAF